MSVKILTITFLLFFVSCWSSADATSQMSLPCCIGSSSFIDKKIVKCFQLVPRYDCGSKDYTVQTEGGKWYCIRFDSKWMRRQIELGKVNCPKITGSSEQE